MKKIRIIISFALCALMSIVCSACIFGHQMIRYGAMFPDVYEANMTYVSGNTTINYVSIKRAETIDGQNCTVHYLSCTYVQHESTTEYLLIWKPNATNWDIYYWNTEYNDWRAYTSSTYDITNFTYNALYMNGVELRKDALVKETSEYLEYTWGHEPADVLRVSNNKYCICLYHGYGGTENVNYHEFTRFVFDASTTAIPHFAQFSLA